MCQYPAEQRFIDLLFRMPLHKAERRNPVSKRADQGPVIEVYIRVDKQAEFKLVFKKDFKHPLRRDRFAIVQELARTLAVAYQQINVIIAKNVALVIADEPLISANNYRIRTIATNNKCFWFHEVLKHPYSFGC